MHLLESASHRFTCVPVTHEVTAGIACEYFNATNLLGERAFALVTAGPGLTNLMTAIAGSWLDSRELLVIGGQAKTTNLARGTVRQLGHQEIDGLGITRSITKRSVRVETPLDAWQLESIISESWTGRPGPVFIEVCLDVSSADYVYSVPPIAPRHEFHALSEEVDDCWAELLDKVSKSTRPLVLLGGGVSQSAARDFADKVSNLKLPIAVTWTGADRVGRDYPFFAGRPNTYGMRWANIFLQQSDLLIAVGTSLGFQQTGFNVDEFLPVGDLVQVDIDDEELNKSTPKERMRIKMDSRIFLDKLSQMILGKTQDLTDWVYFLEEVKTQLFQVESCQKSQGLYLSPHEVMHKVQGLIDDQDCIVSTSSGGTFTAAMQTLSTIKNQALICNKGLASMGYGLAGAIGAAFARPGTRVVLFEGDGGFTQNATELGSVAMNTLNLKVFVTCNDGYASIRTSQANYFGGHYLGCDETTGLLLPNWKLLSSAFEIPYFEVDRESIHDSKFLDAFLAPGPCLFAIRSDPKQTYLPRLTSSLDKNGQIRTRPLHDMEPALPKEVAEKVFRFIPIP